MEVLAPLDCGLVIDVKYLPEEDVLVLVSASGSVVVYHFTSSEVSPESNEINTISIDYK